MAQQKESDTTSPKKFQSLKGFQRFCGAILDFLKEIEDKVSIPKRVSEVLWLSQSFGAIASKLFQSLKGFQRFCGP